MSSFASVFTTSLRLTQSHRLLSVSLLVVALKEPSHAAWVTSTDGRRPPEASGEDVCRVPCQGMVGAFTLPVRPVQSKAMESFHLQLPSILLYMAHRLVTYIVGASGW